MKQLVFMIVATLAGTAGCFLVSPFWGIFIYYFFAVLRPQYIWQWSLPPDVTWSYYVALAAMGAALLGLGGVLKVDPRPTTFKGLHRLTLAHFTVSFFGVWIVITYLMARDREWAHPWFMEYVKIFIMYAVGAYLVRTLSQVWALFMMIAVTLSYIAYEVNFMYFAYQYLGIWKNGYGGLDNNGAGLMLAMGIPVCWFVFEGMQKPLRWAFVALIPVLIHAVLMTYSRGAMVSLLVASPFLILRSKQRLYLGLFGLVIAAVAIPVMAGPEIKARFFSLEQHEVDESANSRRAAWAAAWQIAMENPVFGVGVRNANLFSHRYGADVEGRTIHSQYLQVAADNGFVGLAAYLCMLAGAWLSLRRCRRTVAGREDVDARRLRALASGIECSILVYAVGAAFLSLEVFELPYLLLLLAAQLGLVCQAPASSADPSLLSLHSRAYPETL